MASTGAPQRLYLAAKSTKAMSSSRVVPHKSLGSILAVRTICAPCVFGIRPCRSSASVVRPKGAATDKQIDRLVYQLYGLADDEIHTVEDATP